MVVVAVASNMNHLLLVIPTIVTLPEKRVLLVLSFLGYCFINVHQTKCDIVTSHVKLYGLETSSSLIVAYQ